MISGSLTKVPQAGSLSDPELSAGLSETYGTGNGNQIADIRLMQCFHGLVFLNRQR